MRPLVSVDRVPNAKDNPCTTKIPSKYDVHRPVSGNIHHRQTQQYFSAQRCTILGVRILAQKSENTASIDVCFKAHLRMESFFLGEKADASLIPGGWLVIRASPLSLNSCVVFYFFSPRIACRGERRALLFLVVLLFVSCH